SVGDLRLTDISLDLELSKQSVDDNFEVKLTHTGNNRLSGLFIDTNREGRIFFSQPTEGIAELVAVCLGLGFDGDRDNRIREVHRLEDDRRFVSAERVACCRVLQTYDSDDVASYGFLNIGSFICLKSDQTANTFALVLGAVQHVGAGAQLAAVDSNEGQ